MWVWLRTFVLSFLYDEAAFQRYIAAGAYLLGNFIETGGVVPGTSAVVPVPHALSPYAPVLKAAAFYLGAGGALPSRKSDPSVPPKP